MELVIEFTMLSFFVAAASISTTRSKLARWFREDILDKRLNFKLLNDLLGCPYCIAHWFAICVTPLIADTMISFMVYWFALIGSSALLMGWIMKGLMIYEHEIQRLKGIIKDLEQERGRP